MHPQQLIHRSSLLNHSASFDKVHLPSNYQSDNAGSKQAQAFWLNAASAIDWFKFPSAAYAKNEWFHDGVLNTTYNCLDRHVKAGRGDKVAFHHVSPMKPAAKKPETSYTYNQVLTEVRKLAGVLKHTLGVKKGDRVIIYMSMVPECAFAMLACARIGAIHSVVFGGFGAKELAKRIDDAQPKAILATSCGIEPRGVLEYKPILDEAFQHSKHPPGHLLLLNRDHIHPVIQLDSAKQPTRELDWATEIKKVEQSNMDLPDCEPMKSSDGLYILYTSGSTAAPKGVYRTNGGHAVATLYCMQHTFAQQQQDVFFCASDFGWVVGHSYILYAPLLLGCTSVIFEGKPILPDAGIWWKIVEKYKVTGLFTAPTALRAVRKEDPDAKLMSRYNIKSLRTIFLAGERSEPEIISLFSNLLKKYAAPHASINDNYWSTESGSPISARMLTPAFASIITKPGSAGMPLPGMDLAIVDDEGKEITKPSEMGNLVIRKPLSPSFTMTLWNDEKRYQSAYFDRFKEFGKDVFDTGDVAILDEDGYLHVLSRSDDVINVAGHRLSTSLLEQVIVSHPQISEACVVGAPDSMKGHTPFALVTLSSSESADMENILKNVNQHIRKEVGAIAALSGLVGGRQPKTRSGKTLRRSIREAVEAGAKGKYDVRPTYPPTIEDVSALEESTKNIYEYFQRKQGQPKAKL